MSDLEYQLCRVGFSGVLPPLATMLRRLEFCILLYVFECFNICSFLKESHDIGVDVHVETLQCREPDFCELFFHLSYNGPFIV